MMAYKKDDYIDLLVLCALALVPLLWFRQGYDAVAGFDYSVYLNPIAALKRSFFLWSDNMAGGYDSSHEVSSMAYYLIFSVPIYLGLSLYTAEKIVFASIFALQGFSMYYMMGVLFAGHAGLRAARLIGAFLYAFSFPVMAHFGRGNLMALLAYAMLPLLIGLLKKGFEEKARRWRYVFLLSLLMFPFASVKGHPADFLVIILIAAFFISLNVLIAARKTALEIIKFTSLALSSCVLVSLWWLVPNAMYLADFGLSAGDLVSEGFFNMDILSYYSSGSSLLKAFRNESLDLWFDIPSGILFNPEIYQSILFILIGILFPVTAFICLLRERIGANLIFFSVVGLGALFMFKGNHAPLGWVFEYLYMHVPGFFLFRAPYRIFSSLLTFAMAPLCAFAFTAGYLAIRCEQGKAPVHHMSDTAHEMWAIDRSGFKRLFIRVVSVFFFLSAALYAWPVFTGAHMREIGTAREPGVFQNIPRPYFEAAAWANGLTDHSKIYFPYEIYDLNATWGYNGPDPLFELIEAPKMVSRPNGTVYVRYQRPVEEINRLLRSWEYGDLKAVAGLQGARYIFLHDDLNRWSMAEYNFNEYSDSLFNVNGIGLKNDFGPVRVYENPASVERLYISGESYLYSGDTGGLPDLSLAGYLDRPFLIFAGDIKSGAEAEASLKHVSGLILRNSTLSDAVVGMLSSSHPGEYKDGDLRFNAEKSGRHSVYMLDDGSNSLYFGGGGLAVPNDADDTIIWRRLATIDAREGANVARAQWHFSSARALRARFAVIPDEDLKRFLNLIEGRISSNELEPVFLFSGKGAGRAWQYAHAKMGGVNGYGLSGYLPERYERVVEDAFDKALSWEVKGGVETRAGESTRLVLLDGHSSASVIIRLPDIDVGQYPRLVFGQDISGHEDGSFALTAEMDFYDRSGSKERLVITEKEIRSAGGAVNILDVLGKNASRSIYHDLREARLILTRKNISAGEVSVQLPRLEGEFGVKKKGCVSPSGHEIAIKYSGSYGQDEMPCGKWFSLDVKKVAERGISGNDLDKDIVFVLRKEGRGRIEEPRRLEFVRENSTRYKLKLNQINRAQIVFSESFDKDWRLTSAMEEISPVRVNGYGNGFFVDVNGEQEYTLEYLPQRFYKYAGIASAVSLAAIAFMAVAEWRGNKKAFKAKG